MILGLLQRLDELDGRLVIAVNSLHNPFLDTFFATIAGRFFWIPFYALLVFLLYRRFGKGLLWILLFITIGILFSDQFSSSLLKPLVGRLRPCHDPRIAPYLHLVNDTCGGVFGFVSSHAANTFTLVSFLWMIFGRRFSRFMLLMIVWASMVSFSRIYLGVHYPGDVLAGALIGLLSGSAAGKICNHYLLKHSVHI